MRPRRADAARVLTRLWLGSAAFVLYASLLPFDFRWSLPHAWARAAIVAPVSLADILQNALLLVPFGFLGALAWRRRSVGDLHTLLIVASTGLLLSVLSESLQLFTTDRVASVTDVLTQCAGTCVGAFAALGEDRLWTRWVESTAARHGANPWSYPLSVAAIVVAIAAWEPFNAGLDVGIIWDKLKALDVDAWQISSSGDELLQFLRHAAFAFVASAWAAWHGVRRPVLAGTFGAIGVGLVLEASQLFIDSRMPSCLDALIGASGALLGGAAAGMDRPLTEAGTRTGSAGLTRAWRPLVIVGSAIGGAVQMLTPAGQVPGARTIAWLPFRAMVDSAPTQIVSHYLELALIYIPIGIALSASPPGARRGTVVSGVAAVAVMQFGIELLQQHLPGRYPDATDVIVAVAATVIGVRIDAVRRGVPT